MHILAKVKIKVAKAINLAKQNLFGIKSISKFVTSQTLDGILIASKVITFINCFLPFLLGFPNLAFIMLLTINIVIIATLKKSSTWFLIAFPVWLFISIIATMIFFYVYNPAPLLSYEWFVRMEFFGEKPYAVIFFFLMFMGPSPTVLFYAFTLHLLETFKVFNYEILIGGFLVGAYVVISTLSATILTLFWLSMIIYSIRNAIASGTVSIDILEKWKKYVARLTTIKVESRKIKILILTLLFIFSITSMALYIAYSSSHAPPYPKVLWIYTTENSVYSSPALSDLNGDGKIDVVVGSLDYNVYAIDGETGHLLWSFKTKNQISSSPAIGDLNNDGKLEVIIGSKDRNVYALNGENGTLLWEYTAGNSISVSPVLGDVDDDGKLEVIIGCSNGLVYVLNGESGTLLWKRDIGNEIVVSPALGDINNDGILEIVIPNDLGFIYALSGKNGSQLWFYPVLTAIDSSPAIGDLDGDNLMEVVIGCGDWEIYALNGEDGSVLWKFHARSPLKSSPALGDINSDGKLEVVIGDLSHRVYAINGSNGSLLWKEYVEGRVRSSPAIGDVDNNNRLDVIIHTDLGYLYALDGEDGHVLWRYETHGGYSSPALGDIDRDGKIEIVLGSFDKKIYALNFPDEKNSGFRVYWSNFGGNLLNNRNAKALDPDEDCLSNYSESVIKTKPDNNDTDGDGMPDEWEVLYNLNPLDASDASKDLDNDGLTNIQEYKQGTNPQASDTDVDLIPDDIDMKPLDAFYPMGPIAIISIVMLSGVFYVKWMKKEYLTQIQKVFQRFGQGISVENTIVLLRFIMILNGFLSINPWLPVFVLVFALNIGFFMMLSPKEIKNLRLFQLLIIIGTLSSIPTVLHLQGIISLGPMITILYMLSFIGPSLGFASYYLLLLILYGLGIIDKFFEENYLVTAGVPIVIIIFSNMIMLILTILADKKLREISNCKKLENDSNKIS